MKTEEFEMYLRSTNLSENTISSYLFAVKQFFGQYDEVTKRGLRDHKIWLIESYKPKTVNLRIRAAQRFLCETDLRISDIAGLTGFSDANYFSNTFRRYTGCSPRAYREKQNRLGADASAGL